MNLKNTSNFSLVSYFQCPISNIKPGAEVTLVEVHQLIVSEIFREKTLELRSITDLADAKKLKSEKFDYVTFSGTFTQRSNNSLLYHSGYLVLDLDDLADPDTVKNTLLQDALLNPLLLFRSPSGNGLKVIVAIDISSHSHAENFKALSAYLKTNFTLNVDPSGKDVSRACFLSYDPQAYIHPQLIASNGNGEQAHPRTRIQVNEWLEKQEVSLEFTYDKDEKERLIHDLEVHLRELEIQKLDITFDYHVWRNIGFALAFELGELGRPFFHRFSSFYPNYDDSKCNAQYTKCMLSKGNGIKKGTLFHYLHKAGIKIIHNNEGSRNEGHAPTLQDDIFHKLPHFLTKVIDVAKTKEERDIMLLGAVVCVSAVFPTVYGIYDGNRVFPNLFLFISAKASSGKGRLNNCRQLIVPVHEQLKARSMDLAKQYDLEMAEYQACKKQKGCVSEMPSPIGKKMLFIPANSSASGFIKLLNDNEGRGILFSTEGDTLTETFKSEHGNYSEVLRKCFHHEPVDFFRKTDAEYVSIDCPKFSLLLTGTPKQVAKLMRNTENGLFSRFMYYKITTQQDFKNVFETQGLLDDHFLAMGEQILDLHNLLEQRGPVEVILTERQRKVFHQHFLHYQKNMIKDYNDDYVANVRRMGLIAFRLCMIFSVLRIRETGIWDTPLVVDDRDFDNALAIAQTLLTHGSMVYADLSQHSGNQPPLDRTVRFFERLPDRFTRKVYLAVAKEMGIPQKTVDRWILEFVSNNILTKDSYNGYAKCQASQSFLD